MDRETVNKIAATFTSEPVNHDLEVRLPGAVVEFLIRWAGAGVSESPRRLDDEMLEIIQHEIDNQILRQVTAPIEAMIDRMRDRDDEDVEPHIMTEQGDGSVFCTCQAQSQRFGTRRGQKEWMSDHRRSTRA